MTKKNTSKTNKEVIALARKQGKRDGKNQVPRQDWGRNSVPFLIQLQRNYAAQGRELDLELEQMKLGREAQKIGALKTQIQEKGRSSAMEKNLERAEVELNRLQAQLDGGTDEVPMAKFARFRSFPAEITTSRPRKLRIFFSIGPPSKLFFVNYASHSRTYVDGQ